MKKRKKHVLKHSQGLVPPWAFKRMMEELEIDVRRASAPQLVQTRVLQHEAMAGHFDSSVWGCAVPGLLGRAVVWFKLRQFNHYV